MLTKDVDSRHLVHALERGEIGLAVTRLDWALWRAAFQRAALPVIRDTMFAGAEQAALVTDRIEKQQTLEGAFDQTNPRAVRVAAAIAAAMVTEVSQATIFAMRDVIVRGQSLGLSVFQQANELERILREMAGLDKQRAIALVNYEASQFALGLPPETVAARVATRRNLLIRARALTIARHETMDAANAGQVELWDQAEEEGLLPVGLEREWIVTDDKRLCPICRPMSGQKRRKGQLFRSTFNGQSFVRPPAHVLCRCAMALVIEDD